MPTNPYFAYGSNRLTRRLRARARRAGDILKKFGVEAIKRPDANYLHRADIPREKVARVVSQRITGINCGSFSASVEDHVLHDTCFGVWSHLRGIDDRYASH